MRFFFEKFDFFDDFVARYLCIFLKNRLFMVCEKNTFSGYSFAEEKKIIDSQLKKIC